MKIAHICLSSFYIEGAGYQENELIREHVNTGHDVLVIASTESFGADSEVTYVEPGEFISAEGAQTIRLAYVGWPHKLARKLRIHKGVYQLLEEFQPDAILFHSLCGWELLTVARYKRDHPEVLFYADSHEDPYNSARNFISREILHKGYYKPIIRRALKDIDKVLCLSVEVMDFVQELYGIPEAMIEFFPLGSKVIDHTERLARRGPARAALGFEAKHKVLLQSGKQTKRKKLLEALHAFIAHNDPDLRFIIIGRLMEDIKEVAEVLIASDERISFLGWKTPDELLDLMCAADVYLQPGTQSATMQAALGAGCAVVIDNVPSHQPYSVGNAWLLDAQMPLEKVLGEISGYTHDELAKMGHASNTLALEMLDYRRQAERVLRPEVSVVRT